MKKNIFLGILFCTLFISPASTQMIGLSISNTVPTEQRNNSAIIDGRTYYVGSDRRFPNYPAGQLLSRTTSDTSFHIGFTNLSDAPIGISLTAVGNSLYFISRSKELWEYRNNLVSNLKTKSAVFNSLSNFHDPVSINNKLHFVASHADFGEEIWVMNRPNSDPYIKYDINKGPLSYRASGLRNEGNMLFFLADDGSSKRKFIEKVCSDISLPEKYYSIIQAYQDSFFFNKMGCDKLIAKIIPLQWKGENIMITASVWVDRVPSADLVKRHYEIVTYPPSKSEILGHTIINPPPDLRITLYFTQQDFNDYNTTSKRKKLPGKPADAAGISNVRIAYYKGKSKDRSGLPTTYEQLNTQIIKPDEKDVRWNSETRLWEVCFLVSSIYAGGFIVQTDEK